MGTRRNLDFSPHTAADEAEMLAAIGVSSVDELFEPIPGHLRLGRDLEVPPALSELELIEHAGALAARNKGAGDLTCFAGGGAYEHYVPAIVRAMVSRGEFATSYTPYQPELSQGVLQAIFEFQTMVCELYGMEVANASLYDGASALVEAVNLTVRATKRERILIGGTIHPHYLAVLKTWTSGLGFDIETVPFGSDGVVDWGSVDATDAAAVVVADPNFFGRLEDLETAANNAHEKGALCIAITDPTAMGVLRSPGDAGADVAVGEGQAFGNPLTFGGPYVGYFATKLDLVRQVPGRIAGETLDSKGGRAYVLTLQAREQHIRRAKATSNVCTNQTLMAIASAVHMAWLGPQGLQRMGEICARRTGLAARLLAELPGCRLAFDGPVFKEFVLETPMPAKELIGKLAERGYLAGPDLGRWYPDLANHLLIAVTEKRTEQDIHGLAEAIEKALTER
jgi:glycine dehydrogenase subunit 1